MIAFVDILFAAQSYFSPYGVFDVEQLAFDVVYRFRTI